MNKEAAFNAGVIDAMEKVADAMTRFMKRTGRMAKPQNVMQATEQGIRVGNIRKRVAEAVSKRGKGMKKLPSSPGRVIGVQENIKSHPKLKDTALKMMRKGEL